MQWSGRVSWIDEEKIRIEIKYLILGQSMVRAHTRINTLQRRCNSNKNKEQEQGHTSRKQNKSNLRSNVRQKK